MATKILFYDFAPGLYSSPDVELVGGDEATIFLDQERIAALPASIPALVLTVEDIVIEDDGCPKSGKRYALQYDDTALIGAVSSLAACDVVSVAGRSCCELLREDLEVVDQKVEDLETDLDTWDTIVQNSVPTNGTPGVPQEETQNAIGSIVGGGTLILTVTGAGITGSPLAIPFNVDAGDGPSIWAAKAAAALDANAAVGALYNGTNVGFIFGLKEKVPNGNDGTLNIAIAAGTATGITPDATSDNTVAGVAEVAASPVPARVGQHLHYGDRVFEATSAYEWTELVTPAAALLYDRAQSLTSGQQKQARDNANAARGDMTYESTVQAVETSSTTGVDDRSLFFVAYENGAGQPDAFQSFVLLDGAAPTWTEASGGIAPTDNPGKYLAAVVSHLHPQKFYQSVDPTGVKDNAHGYLFLSLWYNQLFGRLWFQTGGATPGAATWEEFPRQRAAATAVQTTGFTVLAPSFVDFFGYYTAAGTLATGTVNLPATANSRAGQKVEFIFNQTITALTVAVAGGGTLAGTTLTTAAPNVSYEYTCVTPGTWVRTR